MPTPLLLGFPLAEGTDDGPRAEGFRVLDEDGILLCCLLFTSKAIMVAVVNDDDSDVSLLPLLM